MVRRTVDPDLALIGAGLQIAAADDRRRSGAGGARA
jgi:hypothetical protein